MVDCIWILMDYITNFPDNQIIRTIIRRRNFELSPVLARHFTFKFLNIKLTSFRRLQWKIHQNLPPPDPFQRFASVFFGQNCAIASTKFSQCQSSETIRMLRYPMRCNGCVRIIYRMWKSETIVDICALQMTFLSQQPRSFVCFWHVFLRHNKRDRNDLIIPK